MSQGLLRHLFRSRDVRAALVKECARFAVWLALFLGSLALFRHFVTGKDPLGADVAVMAVGMLLAWTINAVRTLRAVLREHGELQ